MADVSVTLLDRVADWLTQSALAGEAPNLCDWVGPWAPAGPMASRRDGATATTLNDGRVLFVGGWERQSRVTGSEDPFPSGNGDGVTADVYVAQQVPGGVPQRIPLQPLPGIEADDLGVGRQHGVGILSHPEDPSVIVA